MGTLSRRYRRALALGLCGAAALALCLPACEKQDDDEKVRAEPVRVALGACAGPTARFESGPKPQAFDLGEVEAEMAKLLPALKGRMDAVEILREELKEKERTLAIKPAEVQMHRGGAAAMKEDPEDLAAIEKEEGKEEEKPTDPQRAKELALEQARSAGVIAALKRAEGGAFATLTSDESDLAEGSIGGLLGDGFDSSQGGFGFGNSGLGGGGGTGWGTIGSGGLGSSIVDSGSGSGGFGFGVGSGRGGMRGRRSNPPEVRIGSATATGNLDKNIIRRYIRRKLPRIKYCYEKQLLIKPGLAGTVTSSFIIDKKGRVIESSAEGVNKDVSACISGVIKTIKFPKPKGGGIVRVSYPFTFRPGGPPEGDASGDGKDDDKSGDDDSKKKQIPSTDSPLQAHKDELDQCFRRARRDFGAMFVELKLGEGGVVTEATGVGAGDEKTNACVAEVAKKLQLASPPYPVMRCPIAFGDMPTDATQTIDITNEVQLESRPMATLARIVDDENRDWKLSELHDFLKLQADIDKNESGQQPIAIRGPNVIRPLDTTPMKAVLRVLRNVWLSNHENWVLAAQDGDSWRLLPHELALPVAPVPLDTGEDWMKRKKVSRSAFARLDGEAPVRASVLIQENTIWVGLSRVNEFRQVGRAGDKPDGPMDWKALEAILAEHKASPNFENSQRIDIAAEDKVPYKQLVQVIDLANKTGFTDWRVTGPSNLSARPQL